MILKITWSRALRTLDQQPGSSSSCRSSASCSPPCLRMRRCQPRITRCRGGWLTASSNLLPCSGPWARWRRDLGPHQRSVWRRNNSHFAGRPRNTHHRHVSTILLLGNILYFFFSLSLSRTPRLVRRMSRPPNCLPQVPVNRTPLRGTKAPRPSPAFSLPCRCPLVASRGSTVKMDPPQR